MKFWLPVIFFFFLSSVGLAQYTNNWVAYNQRYYKINVATTGIFRLTYDQLQQAGVPVNSIDPRLIQIFRRGKEQAIYFKHDQQPADSKFDNDEYLEFYGERNDGTMDSKLYQPVSVQPNNYYNLYSDTSAYFLTVNPLPVLGKRMESFDEVNSTPIAKEAFHTAEQLRVYTTEYGVGDIADVYVTQSFFDQGEGWTSTTICSGNASCVGLEQRDFSIDQLTNTITSQPPPQLEIQLTGRDALRHLAEIYVGPSTGSMRLLTSKQFLYFETPIYSEQIQWSDIGADGRMLVRVKAIGVDGGRDRLSVAYIKVNFAQSFNIASATSKNFTLRAGAGNGSKGYIEIENAPNGMRLWDVTDPSEVLTIGTRAPGGSLLTAVVPNTTTSRKLYASSTFMVPDVSQIKPVMFRELNANAQFLFVTHRSLRQSALQYSDPVKAFAEYRASDAGGGYDTLIANVDELYDQFNYGETSPVAIYEFMRYMLGEGDPQYLFLVGKGRDVSAAMYRRAIPANESKDLVPTGGSPGSDMTFTAGMDGNPYVPAVATGRITANTPTQVAAYLNKVKEAEAAPFDDLNRKKLLHLSGGKEVPQLELFRSYMDGFANIAEGPYLGGTVATVAKRGISDVEFINVVDQVNAGVNMVTFFGHSAPNVTDIDIGFADDPVLGYNNKGKYPAFLVNGCNAGEYFNNGESFGENWTMIADKGARNFIANSSFGFEIVLREYTNYFYNVGFADSIFLARGIGDVQKEVARRILNDFGNSKSVYTAQVQQMVLLGDPSLKLFAPTKPDFETEDALIDVVSFDGKPIHALTDSLQLLVITKNLGRATKLPLTMKVVHTIDDIQNEYTVDYPGVLSSDTLKLTIIRDGNFYGNNKIEVFLDPENEIAELNEENNHAQWTKFILFNGTLNLQPADFGIVASTTVDVLFQNTNNTIPITVTDEVTPENTYVIELDTVKSFDSPFFVSKQANGKTIVKSGFNLLDKDSTVYYWRTRPSLSTDDQWEMTSFTYIKDGPKGWTQMAFDQLTENTLDGLVPDGANRRFQFDKKTVSLSLKIFGDENAEPGITPSLIINNAEVYYSPAGSGCRTNTINLVAFDRSTVNPYAAIPFDFSNSFGRECGREPIVINSFTAAETDTGNNDDITEYVNNLKAGDSVVLFTVGDADFASWTSAAKSKLEEIGVLTSDIETFQPGEPIIIFGKKGAIPGMARIIRSDQAVPQEQKLEITEDLTGYITSGAIESVTIGPALAWHDLTSRFKLVDDSDEAGVDVYVVDKTGNETIYTQQQQNDRDISDIDASQYPFLKLIYKTSDEVQLTPAPLKFLLVSYDPAPDGILLPASAAFPSSTVPEGATHASDFMFMNISNVDFTDSLTSVFSLLNRNTRTKETREFKIKGPAVGETTFFSQTVETLGKAGFNDLSMTVNTEFVPEQYLQNNSMEIASYLNVIKDQSNPQLEVLVDGRFLSNGDFVSANPEIRVTLRDENHYILLKDTTTLNVLMSYPCDEDECPIERIAFSSSDVSWSIEKSGELTMVFTPKDLPEGEYVLYASGADASGNSSGDEPYKVSFIVDRDPGLIFYSPYPNPSSVGFNFDFTVAGEDAPESFALQIIDRIGQSVANFTEHDTPPLRVGTNQLRWTGVDSNGSRLSDGLYFYQIRVRTGGNEYKNSGRLLIIK